MPKQKKLNETFSFPLAGFPLHTHAFFKFSNLEELPLKQRPSVWLESSFRLPFAYLSLSNSCHSRFRRLVWLQSFDGWVLIFLNKWSDCIANKSEGEIFAPLQLRNRWCHIYIKRPPPTRQTHLVDSPIFRVFVFFCFLSEMAGMSWWRLISAALAGILYFHSFCLSDQAPNYSFMQQATKAQAVSYYDYIIIGGGTAGCPLAATLSLNFKVLLLERGDSPYGNQNISNLVNFGDTLSDLSPTSPSQRFISEDGVINARARVLGGGSCLNAGFYTRASPSYVSASGWDGRLVNRSYEWVERLVAFEPPVLQWQSAVRDGLVEVGVLPYNGFTYDHMYGTKVGGSIFDKDGHRHTAADLLKYANPSGLTVLLHATVHRILFRTAGKVKPLAHGVIFRDGKGGVHRAYLNKGSKNEIIVSAGAIGSPQLLMLSGIGPARQLQKLGIKVTVDQPLVGQGMSDNPMNAIYIPSPSPVEVSLIQVVGITRFGSYIEAASGSNFAPRTEIGPQRNFGMFSPQTGQISTVPPKQRTPEAIEKAVKAMNGLQVESFRGGFILEKVMGPISTGHLELKNRNPNDNPSVTFNYFKEPQDLQRCVEGIRTIERVVQSKPFSKFRYPYISLQALINMTSHFPVNMLPRHENDSTSLEQFCKDTVMTIWHYHGGCQVGRVVDLDYRVLGVDALRVIDGSTFNYSPGTNPQATVMMLGRYMGIKIRNQRLGMNGLD